MAKEETTKESIDDVLKSLNKEYGANAVISLGDKQQGTYDVIPSGSITFDYEVLGIGGFAKGRLYELRGFEGSGKTTLCGHVCAEAQKKGERVLYIDSEFALDKVYLSALGVDVNKLLISQPSNAEEGINIVMKLVATGEIGLVIIDSDTALLPKSVLENEIGASNIGKKAKFNSDTFPKLKKLANEYNTCFIFSEQYREKIGVLFSDPKTTTGGKSASYYADCIIELSKKLKKEGDETVAHIVKMKTIKNKTYSPFKHGEVEVWYGVGINKFEEILVLGNQYQILKKWGKTITFNETKYSVEEFEDLIRDNEEFKAEIISKIKQAINEV